MAPVTRRKLCAQPNAGMPRDVGGRSMYMASPEYMATYARHLVQAGVKVIGGCCGTTPEHIKRDGGRRSVRSRRASCGAPNVRRMAPARDATPRAPQHPRRRSALRAGAARRALALGEEDRRRASSSPRSRSCRRAAWMRRRMLADVAQLKDAGVDAVNVPDGPRAQSRMGAHAHAACSSSSRSASRR